MPIITEMNGIANFVDLTEGVSVREVTDDATGIASRRSLTGNRLQVEQTFVHALLFVMKRVRF